MSKEIEKVIDGLLSEQRNIPKAVDRAMTRKPWEWSEVGHTDDRGMDRHEIHNFAASLPRCRVDTSNLRRHPIDIRLDPDEFPQWFVMMIGDRAFLVDTEGYSYPRYIVEIPEEIVEIPEEEG